MRKTMFLSLTAMGYALLTGCGSDEQTASGGSSGGSAGSTASIGGGRATGGNATATGGAHARGGSSSGGAAAGGASSGGNGTGNGGTDAGGQSAGGASLSGGASSGGASLSGGASSGGASGSGKGGSGNGGTPTAGASGSGKGGAGNGGTSTAGASSGGASRGGANSGGIATGGAAAGGGTNLDPHGFNIRLPTTHQVTCAGGVNTLEDADWICTFTYGSTKGFVYVQSTPVDCKVLMGAIPVFSSVAQISINGQVTSLSSASYDWGGNHHNDMLSFTYGGNGYNYYHSSFGFGWRACHNMDCLQVSAGATGTVTSDGCTSARTLPQVCSKIAANGTYADLSVDTFAKCPGDKS